MNEKSKSKIKARKWKLSLHLQVWEGHNDRYLPSIMEIYKCLRWNKVVKRVGGAQGWRNVWWNFHGVKQKVGKVAKEKLWKKCIEKNKKMKGFNFYIKK